MEGESERIARIENRLEFQGRDLEQMDESLAAQQREIESLSARVSALERLITRLDPSLFGDGPPHRG